MRSDFVATISRYIRTGNKSAVVAFVEFSNHITQFANEALASCGVERLKYLQELAERRAEYLDPMAW